jgi:hypothetical protein
MFALAGIEIGGRRSWDLQVYDERFYQRLLSDGSLASGESYMDGWWDAGDHVTRGIHEVLAAAREVASISCYWRNMPSMRVYWVHRSRWIPRALKASRI